MLLKAFELTIPAGWHPDMGLTEEMEKAFCEAMGMPYVPKQEKRCLVPSAIGKVLYAFKRLGEYTLTIAYHRVHPRKFHWRLVDGPFSNN